MRVLVIGGCGYIGSAIYRHLNNVPEVNIVDTVDIEWFGGMPYNDGMDYRDLDAKELSDYDAVIMVAAHSSVAMCQKDPYGAFENNVGNFVALLRKLESIKKNRPKLIYASSSCVYTGTLGFGVEGQELPPPVDHLTLTKQTIDRYAQMSDVEFYGLRLGSVNGWSPNLRGDLMINAMTIDSIYANKVTITNPEKWRPILGMNDLCRAIHTILEKTSSPSNCDLRGIYNLCSFNDTIGMIGTGVADEVGAKIEVKDAGGGYDFRMSMVKFMSTFGFLPEDSATSITKDLRDHIATTKAPPVDYAKYRDINKEYRIDAI